MFYSKSKFITELKFPIQIPSNIYAHICQFDTHAYHDSLFNAEKIELTKNICRSVTKRKAEYLAGRIMAKRCLNVLELRDYNLAIDENRSPIWPAKVLGSISHANSMAACIATHSGKVKGIGVDIEPLITHSLVDEIEPHILTMNENRFLECYEPSTMFTLIFSAKEAIYKALYPTAKSFLDFDTVSIQSINRSLKIMEFNLNKDIQHTFKAGRKINVQFNVLKRIVYTICII